MPLDLNNEISKEIKKRAKVFVYDNYNRHYTDYELRLIENAMLIGASIAFEKETEFTKR
jgi:hypothetical protein